jgi:hypothetical protein
MFDNSGTIDYRDPWGIPEFRLLRGPIADFREAEFRPARARPVPYAP